MNLTIIQKFDPIERILQLENEIVSLNKSLDRLSKNIDNSTLEKLSEAFKSGTDKDTDNQSISNEKNPETIKQEFTNNVDTQVTKNENTQNVETQVSKNEIIQNELNQNKDTQNEVTQVIQDENTQNVDSQGTKNENTQNVETQVSKNENNQNEIIQNKDTQNEVTQVIQDENTQKEINQNKTTPNENSILDESSTSDSSDVDISSTEELEIKIGDMQSFFVQIRNKRFTGRIVIGTRGHYDRVFKKIEKEYENEWFGEPENKTNDSQNEKKDMDEVTERIVSKIFSDIEQESLKMAIMKEEEKNRFSIKIKAISEVPLTNVEKSRELLLLSETYRGNRIKKDVTSQEIISSEDLLTDNPTSWNFAYWEDQEKKNCSSR